MDGKKRVLIINNNGKMDLPQVTEWLKSYTDIGISCTGPENEKGCKDLLASPEAWYCLPPEVISRIKERMEQLEWENCRFASELSDLKLQSRIDPLTGVLNRSGIVQKIKEILDETPDMQNALCFLDLDDFKKVNDSFGHSYGDKVLIEMAQQLRQLSDKDGVVGRFGGDEFLIFLRDVRSREDIMNRAGMLCRNLKGGEHGEVLSASIGVAVYPEDGRDFGTLLQKADQALYRSKCRESGWED